MQNTLFKYQKVMKIPYGESNFREVALGKFYYIDKTQYIETLEDADEKYVFFLRPRRFGKSLFVSMLEYYYGEQHKDEFEQMFGKLYIGKNPTPLANSYLVLKFEFSGIETETKESTKAGFLKNVKNGILQLMSDYDQYFKEEDFDEIKAEQEASECAKTFFNYFLNRHIKQKIYLLIDEYDHFANDLLAFRYNEFTASTQSGGYIRSFYEVLKTATHTGIINRIFITGVTPITLDSLTSGFNICGYRTTDLMLNEMMGFTETEVENLITQIAANRNFTNFKYSDIATNLRKWYNGYLFHNEAENRIYNPDMILYFASEYTKTGFKKFPGNIVDENVVSDYLKIQSLFGLKDKDLNYTTLDTLLCENSVTAKLRKRFNLSSQFTRDDFVSLLFYMGFISIKEGLLSLDRFAPPNFVIELLFYDYFLHLVKNHTTVDFENQRIGEIILELAQNNNIQPLVELTEKTLQNISNRDYIKLDEKHIKLLFIAYTHAAGIYYIKSEAEINRKYPDLMLLYRAPFFPNYQFLFEFKYVKKEDAPKPAKKNKAITQLQEKKEEAITQLITYSNSPESKDFIGTQGGGMKTVKGYVIVFVGDKAEIVEEIDLFQKIK